MVAIGIGSIPWKKFKYLHSREVCSTMHIPVMRDLWCINSFGINIEFSIAGLKDEMSSVLEALTNTVAISIKRFLFSKN